ncbi:hypothetical protein GW17_00011427 [Ensete ventricosum]|nr:hypothetical protein GW17_00011427 [Ensete ventricosum]
MASLHGLLLPAAASLVQRWRRGGSEGDVCVRELVGGQREQQLPEELESEGRLLALRDRLPLGSLGEVLQWQKPRRRPRPASDASFADTALRRPGDEGEKDCSWRQLRFRRLRDPRPHRFSGRKSPTPSSRAFHAHLHLMHKHSMSLAFRGLDYGIMNLSSQIGNFEDKTLPELKARLGKGGSRRVVANRFLSQYLFVVGTGGNDYLLNFFAGDAKNSTTMSEFTHHLVSIFSAQLKVKFSCQYDHIDAVCGVTFLVTKITSLLQKLYDLGARKFVLFSIQAMGCVPVVRATVPTANGGCVEAMNEAAILFNSHLRRLADASRRRRMPGSFVVYVNSYKIIRDIINNPIPCGTYLRGLRAACPSAEASFQVSRRRARRAASCRRPWRTGEGYCAEGEGVPAAIATLTSSSTGFTLLMLSI